MLYICTHAQLANYASFLHAQGDTTNTYSLHEDSLFMAIIHAHQRILIRGAHPRVHLHCKDVVKDLYTGATPLLGFRSPFHFSIMITYTCTYMYVHMYVMLVNLQQLWVCAIAQTHPTSSSVWRVWSQSQQQAAWSSPWVGPRSWDLWKVTAPTQPRCSTADYCSAQFAETQQSHNHDRITYCMFDHLCTYVHVHSALFTGPFCMCKCFLPCKWAWE